MSLRVLLLLYISLVLHETGHILATISTKTPIDRLRITMLGFNIQLNVLNLNFMEKLFVYFSGPFTNLIMFCFFYKYELYEAATINAFLCFINLQPIVPLDGGNIIKTLIAKNSNAQIASICCIAINIVFIVVSNYCLYLSSNLVYLAITIISIKGILQEKRNLSEYKILEIYKRFLELIL